MEKIIVVIVLIISCLINGSSPLEEQVIPVAAECNRCQLRAITLSYSRQKTFNKGCNNNNNHSKSNNYNKNNEKDDDNDFIKINQCSGSCSQSGSLCLPASTRIKKIKILKPDIDR